LQDPVVASTIIPIACGSKVLEGELDERVATLLSGANSTFWMYAWLYDLFGQLVAQGGVSSIGDPACERLPAA